MGLSLTTATIQGTRRVRLAFDRQLAAGAFTAVSYYAVTSVDSKGPPTNVVAALAVAASTAQVELVLDADLVEGGTYLFTGTVVPAQDATTFTGSQQFYKPAQMGSSPDAAPQREDADAWLFGIDTLWDGDFVETPQGDLATISGLPSVMSALWRRMPSGPLPWNGEYGGRLNEFVGAPITSQLAARGRLTQQGLRDDRVEAIAVRVYLDETTDPTTPSVVFDITPTLKGGRAAPTFPVSNAL